MTIFDLSKLFLDTRENLYRNYLPCLEDFTCEFICPESPLVVIGIDCSRVQNSTDYDSITTYFYNYLYDPRIAAYFKNYIEYPASFDDICEFDKNYRYFNYNKPYARIHIVTKNIDPDEFLNIFAEYISDRNTTTQFKAVDIFNNRLITDFVDSPTRITYNILPYDNAVVYTREMAEDYNWRLGDNTALDEFYIINPSKLDYGVVYLDISSVLIYQALVLEQNTHQFIDIMMNDIVEYSNNCEDQDLNLMKYIVGIHIDNYIGHPLGRIIPQPVLTDIQI